MAALDAILRLKPDPAVLDISMSAMNGIEVARELRKRSSGIKIVFLTVYKGPDFVEACLAAGGEGYVSKMLISTDLIPAIREVLAKLDVYSSPVFLRRKTCLIIGAGRLKPAWAARSFPR